MATIINSNNTTTELDMDKKNMRDVFGMAKGWLQQQYQALLGRCKAGNTSATYATVTQEGAPKCIQILKNTKFLPRLILCGDFNDCPFAVTVHEESLSQPETVFSL